MRKPEAKGVKFDGGWDMSAQYHDPAISEDAAGTVDVVTDVRREAALLKTGALQNAIFNSENFSSIATDEKGVIQLFNVAEPPTHTIGNSLAALLPFMAIILLRTLPSSMQRARRSGRFWLSGTILVASVGLAKRAQRT